MKKEKWAQAAKASMKRRGTVGSLTRIAKRHGMSPLQFANTVLNNPDKYPKSVVKKANFAHNINERKK